MANLLKAYSERFFESSRIKELIFFLFLIISYSASAQEGAFSPAERDRIKEITREYILENPGIIAEAITLLQTQQKDAQLERQKERIKSLASELRNPPEETIIGNPDGKVTVVEFFDYNCGYCKSMFDTVLQTVQQNDELRIVLIEFPILGPNSVTASKAALAAREQNLYGPFHQALMSHRGSLNESVIMTLARGVGLNTSKLKEDMSNPEISAIIDKNRAIAQDLEISGTPAFVVGSTLVPGALSREQFESLIEQAADSSS
ncbi:MAG: DsbA family protein [Rhodospirillaceae bacterium]